MHYNPHQASQTTQVGEQKAYSSYPSMWSLEMACMPHPDLILHICLQYRLCTSSWVALSDTAACFLTSIKSYGLCGVPHMARSLTWSVAFLLPATDSIIIWPQFYYLCGILHTARPWAWSEAYQYRSHAQSSACRIAQHSMLHYDILYNGVLLDL